MFLRHAITVVKQPKEKTKPNQAKPNQPIKQQKQNNTRTPKKRKTIPKVAKTKTEQYIYNLTLETINLNSSEEILSRAVTVENNEDSSSNVLALVWN